MMELHEENKLMREALKYISDRSRSWEAAAASECLAAVGPAAQPEGEAAPVQHDSDCSLHNVGVPELLGPCDCSVTPAAQPEGEAAPSVDIPFELRELLSQHADERNQGMAGPAMNAIYAWHQAKLAEARQDQISQIIAAVDSDQAEFNRKWAEQRERAEKAEAENTKLLRDMMELSKELNGLAKQSLTAKAAPQAGNALGEVVAGGRFVSNVEWFAGYMPPVGTKLYAAPPATAAPAKLMSVPQVADMLREKNLLTESGMKTFLNGDALRFHPADIARIINAAFATQQVPK